MAEKKPKKTLSDYRIDQFDNLKEQLASKDALLKEKEGWIKALNKTLGEQVKKSQEKDKRINVLEHDLLCFKEFKDEYEKENAALRKERDELKDDLKRAYSWKACWKGGAYCYNLASWKRHEEQLLQIAELKARIEKAMKILYEDAEPCWRLEHIAIALRGEVEK